MRIPDDKHIRFKCPNEACSHKYEYENGIEIIRSEETIPTEEAEPSKVSYVIPVAAVAVALIGSFFSFLLPIPLLVGVAWLIRWMSASSNGIWAKPVASLSFSTAIGLSLLLLLQLILNFFSDTTSDEIPAWLLQLDNVLIWSRENLTYISEISLGVYVIILTTLLYIAFKKPAWKPVSVFVTTEEWIGKMTAILIVITSFTFFAPSVLEQSSEYAYYKRFKVVYREKLTQERRRLIAELLKKQIERSDTSGYAINLPSFYKELETIRAEAADVPDEVRQDASSIAAQYWYINGTSFTRYEESRLDGGTGDGSEENLEKIWKDESINWDTRSPRQEGLDNASDFERDDISTSPRDFVEVSTEEVKKATILADESIEALKAVCLKFAGGFIPGGNALLGKYVEEIVNAAAELVFKKSRVSDLVRYFFDNDRSRGKIDFFSRVGNLWQKIRIQKAELLLAQKEERKRVEEEKRRRIEAEEEERRRVEEERERAAELIRSQAENRLENLISEKVDDLLIKNGGVSVTALKAQVTEDYKRAIDFDRLSKSDYQRIASSNALERNKLQIAMRSALIKSQAENRLENLINEKIDDIVKNGGVNVTVLKAQLTKDYKSAIEFDGLSQSDYQRIASSNALEQNILQTVMRSAASIQLHPGPRVGCPICAYIRRTNSY